MLQKSLTLMFALFLSASAYSQDLQIKAAGKAQTLTKEQIAKIKKQNVAVTDPNESAGGKAIRIQFSAIDGPSLLDLAFGSRKAWQDKSFLAVECADGYKAMLEIKKLRDGGFFFADARSDQDSFTIINRAKDGQKADLKPYYLVWTKDEMQKTELGHYWPYQIVGLTLND